MNDIKELKIELENLPKLKLKKWKEDSYYLLVSMIPSLLKNTQYTNMRVCDEKEQTHLKADFEAMHIKDLKTLQEHLAYNYCNDSHYQQFQTIWQGNPCLDVEQLNASAKKWFLDCESYAKQFKDILSYKGFLAWDIAESVYRIRQAYTLNMIPLQQAKQMIQPYIHASLQRYRNWNEFSISYLCGGMYYMYRETGKLDVVEALQKKIITIIRILFFSEEKNYYRSSSWLMDSKYFTSLDEIQTHKELGLFGSKGCCVSCKVAVEGFQVGYFYREQPENENTDSGWRFFAGDEDETYIQDSQNFVVCSLDMIASFCKELVPYLKDTYHSIYVYENNHYKKVNEK